MKIRGRRGLSPGVIFLTALLLSLALALPGAAAPVEHARVDKAIDAYRVNRDLTYTRVVTEDLTVLTERGLSALDRSEETFYPEKQTLEVVEAWVDRPDGERILVEKSGIFTRPSAASRSAPGFVNSMTTTVLFPRLVPGARTHVVWRFEQKTPGLLGFNIYNMNHFHWRTVSDETRIEIPADVPLRWHARGGFTVDDQTSNGVRRIAARIQNTAAREDEPSTVEHMDFMPLFLATSQARLEDVGDAVHRASAGRANPTPEIEALAARIVGTSTGLDAASAIHAWVAANIRYVAVYLDPDDGWVPHAAADVLKNGYGDCKDYVVLTRALLAARGIEARMAVINWGKRYADLPLGVPYFNHAILYLPAWDRYVNPTDRHARFDALDQRLSGKQVMVVDGTSRIARTPPATPEANRYRYTARVVLTAGGTANGTARYEFSPNQEIPVRSRLSASSSPAEMAPGWLASTPEGGFGDFASSDPRDLTRPLELSSVWNSPRVMNVQGDGTYLRVPAGLDLAPALWERAKLSANGMRLTPLAADVRDSQWETTLVLPTGMTVGTLPPDVDVATAVGRYVARYRRDGRTVVVWRNLVVSRPVVEPADYPDFERLIYAPAIDARAVIWLLPSVE